MPLSNTFAESPVSQAACDRPSKQGRGKIDAGRSRRTLLLAEGRATGWHAWRGSVGGDRRRKAYHFEARPPTKRSDRGIAVGEHPEHIAAFRPEDESVPTMRPLRAACLRLPHVSAKLFAPCRWTRARKGRRIRGMNHRILAVVSLVVAAGGCSSGSVTISGPGDDGKVRVSSSGSEQSPPVGALVGKDGVEQLPTATPGQPTPVYPISTPAPAPTRRPE
jgi:hypothetical protein